MCLYMHIIQNASIPQQLGAWTSLKILKRSNF